MNSTHFKSNKVIREDSALFTVRWGHKIAPRVSEQNLSQRKLRSKPLSHSRYFLI